MVHSDQGTQWSAVLPDLGPQRRSFASPGAWSAHAQAEELSHLALPAVECGPQPLLIGKAGQNT